MSGNQLAERYRPKTWDQFVGNRELIKVLRKGIELDLPASYILEGPSGSGKTTLANIWSTALLCRNREKGTSEPCGICPVCTGEDTLNIHSATIEDATEAKGIINRFIDESITPPRPVESKSGVMRQVIILNELQNASNAAHSMLLDAIESAPSFTTWILVTMSPDRFNTTTLEALRARCIQISLVRKNDEDVANRLKECLPELDEEACKAIGFFSNGNIREAWSILALLHPLHEIRDITSAQVYALKAGGCSNEKREELWDSIARGNTENVGYLIDSWLTSASEETICSLLMKDLRKKLELNDYGSLIKLKHLQQWYRLSKKYPLSICLMGMSCSNFHSKTSPIKEEVEIERPNINTIYNPSSKVNSNVIDNNIKEEAEVNKYSIASNNECNNSKAISNTSSNTSQIIFNQLREKVDANLDILKFKKQVNNIDGEDILKLTTTFRQLRNYFDGN